MRTVFQTMILGAFLACSSEPGQVDKPSLQSADAGTTPDGPATSDVSSVVATDDAGQRALLNQVVIKSTHNAFERSEPIFDQLAYHQVRSLEVDVHTSKAGIRAPAGDWFVFHTDTPTQRNSSCEHLSDCLQQVMAFHRVAPQHEVVELMVDLKTAFGGAQSMDALDTILERELGDSLYTPDDLLAHCPGAPDLVSAVKGACSFPTVTELRGRVLVVLTGGSSCKGTGLLATYAGATGSNRSAFIGSGIGAGCTFADYGSTKNSVFYNMNLASAAAAQDIYKAGFIARIYGGEASKPGLDTPAMWNTAKGYNAHILATDKVNAGLDGWASTQSGQGYPFSCIEAGCALESQERGAVLGLDVRSGDIEGVEDSFVFLHDEVPGASTWTSAIASESSHVEPFAKGCLMARVSLMPNSPYFAVCKPADARQMRVQYRTVVGADTSVVEMRPRASWTLESIFFMRLRVTGATVIGEGSTDGLTWTQLAQVTLTSAPTLQGLAASGHDSADSVRFLFRQATRTESGVDKAFTKATAKALACVGTCAKQAAFDGVVP
jgi:hypothetical protein